MQHLYHIQNWNRTIFATQEPCQYRMCIKVLKMNDLITALAAQENKLTMNSLEISELTGHHIRQ